MKRIEGRAVNQLQIEGAENIQVLPISKSEARELIDKIKDKAEELWCMLLEAYEHEVHIVLGYPSWGAFFEAEFGQSGRHGERLLDAGRVLRAIESQNDQLVDKQLPTESQARELAPLAKTEPKEAAKVWQEVVEKHGEDVTAADVRRTVKAGSVGESLTGAIEAGEVLEIPPKQMSESQKQGYKSVERYYTLSHYDPEEVAKAHDPAKDYKSWSEEVERTERLLNWIERYQDALLAMQEKH